MEKSIRCTNEVRELITEIKFKTNDLILELQPLLTDYFECKQIAVKGGAIQMEFYNGQTFLIRAEEL